MQRYICLCLYFRCMSPASNYGGYAKRELWQWAVVDCLGRGVDCRFRPSSEVEVNRTRALRLRLWPCWRFLVSPLTARGAQVTCMVIRAIPERLRDPIFMRFPRPVALRTSVLVIASQSVLPSTRVRLFLLWKCYLYPCPPCFSRISEARNWATSSIFSGYLMVRLLFIHAFKTDLYRCDVHSG